MRSLSHRRLGFNLWSEAAGLTVMWWVPENPQYGAAELPLLKPAEQSLYSVHSPLQLANRLDHFVRLWQRADDHTRHPLVIALEIALQLTSA